ncbi:MAG: aldose 1-epimerase family protein [Nitrososphaeria archaeon]
MVELFNQVYGKAELLKHVGQIDQLGGIRLFELSEGVEKGVRAALFRTGTLNLIVAIDRCMDIVNAEYMGIPLAFVSPTGIVAPSFFEPEGIGWVRGFPGGLLTTCGLTYAGAPTVDQGEQLGLHGRISYSPSRLSRVDGCWDGDNYILALEGESKEAMIFGPNLTLRRRIEAKLGGKCIQIHDRVVNQGWERQPLMIIYHMNLGFPLLDANSRMVSTSRTYFPRDAEAKVGAERFNEFQPPNKGFREKVYIHDLAADSDGYSYAALINDSLMNGLGFYIKLRKRELPRLVQWKMMGEGTYVLGMEPSNGFVMRRDKERELGTLQFIEPQEEREFHLEAGVLVGDEIREYDKMVNEIVKNQKPTMVADVNEFLKTTGGV